MCKTCISFRCFAYLRRTLVTFLSLAYRLLIACLLSCLPTCVLSCTSMTIVCSILHELRINDDNVKRTARIAHRNGCVKNKKRTTDIAACDKSIVHTRPLQFSCTPNCRYSVFRSYDSYSVGTFHNCLLIICLLFADYL